MRPRSWKSGGRSAVDLAAIGGIYAVLATISVAFTRFEGGVAFIWTATAFLSAVLMSRPPSSWGRVLAVTGIASVAATSAFGLGAVAAIPFALVNIGEAVIGAIAARRFMHRCCQFDSLPEIAGFLAIFGGLAPAVSGLFGAAVASVTADVPYASNWLNYFAGHALGAITFTPLFMLVAQGDLISWYRKTNINERLELLALVTLSAVTPVLVFSQTNYPLLFLPLLPMMAAVFRHGRLAAALSIVMLTIVSAALSIDGHGPIALIDSTPGARAQFLQFYLAVAVVMTLPAAAELKHRKKLFTQLQESAALDRLILDRTGDIVMRMEVDGTLKYVSPSIKDIGGYRPEDLVGRKPQEIVHPDDVAEVFRTHRLALASPDETFIVEYRARRSDGREGWFETHTRATIDEAGTPTGAVSIIREITRRKDAESALLRDAATDPLTGLLNRRAFNRTLDGIVEREASTDRSISIAIFDLDHFKSINDTHGHAVGDEVLRAFASLLKGAVRERDVVARLGGEEFVAILHGADAADARTICDRVRERFARHVTVGHDGRLVRGTVSGGIAALQPGWASKDWLLAADRALYAAKSSGRNRMALAA